MIPTRLLPGLIVVGAMRAGTTTLYHHLSNHPEIGMSRMKETDFFVPKMNFPLGMSWYQSQFDPGYSIYGEASPSYAMCHLWRGVPARIHGVLPNVRLIFLARDPVDRFVSHYQHAWNTGTARVQPADLIDSQVGQNMLETSRYARQINAYLEHFPREQLFIIDFDQLSRDPQAVMDGVVDFVGVSRCEIAGIPTRNDAASNARLPGFVQRAWRSRGLRRFDRYISRSARDRARNLLSVAPNRGAPEVGAELRAEVAERLAPDAHAFRALSGLPFDDWQV
ncbi:sulfotransferase family protein [Salipiger aestuarii]|uniref:sulfotransferase family protein n=1 Tax=Salipiger aestuarii TaxID=568098 RepID=UPI00123A7F24|nr:sulfotransferase [Salipiger aestuarii]